MDMDSTPGLRVPHHACPSLKERVQAVDPNEGRCLIENCSSTRAIEHCHLVPRRLSDLPGLLDSLEWYWNMQSNTLNLDTRRNIFSAGASMHRMYDAGRWVLVPEEPIIQQYYDTLDPSSKMAWRASFPNIHDRSDFQYNLLPIKDMEGIAFTRQATTSTPPVPNDFTTHVYPYDTFPTLFSHIHPRSLMQSYPLLLKILALYKAWTIPPSIDYMDDGSFWPPYNPSGNDNDDDRKNEDCEDAVTEKGRYVETEKRAWEESSGGYQRRKQNRHRDKMTGD